MAHTLGNNCAKNLCKQTVLLQFIIKNVVTCFFWNTVYISSFIKIGPVVLALWVVENHPSPLLWPMAYTTACIHRTSRDVNLYSP